MTAVKQRLLNVNSTGKENCIALLKSKLQAKAKRRESMAGEPKILVVLAEKRWCHYDQQALPLRK
jgi:hypothetical protein